MEKNWRVRIPNRPPNKFSAYLPQTFPWPPWPSSSPVKTRTPVSQYLGLGISTRGIFDCVHMWSSFNYVCLKYHFSTKEYLFFISTSYCNTHQLVEVQMSQSNAVHGIYLNQEAKGWSRVILIPRIRMRGS